MFDQVKHHIEHIIIVENTRKGKAKEKQPSVLIRHDIYKTILKEKRFGMFF